MSSAASQYEVTQSRAFTRWMNANLTKSGLSINDVNTDLQDGLLLVALLEQLTGKVRSLALLAFCSLPVRAFFLPLALTCPSVTAESWQDQPQARVSHSEGQQPLGYLFLPQG